MQVSISNMFQHCHASSQQSLPELTDLKSKHGNCRWSYAICSTVSSVCVFVVQLRSRAARLVPAETMLTRDLLLSFNAHDLIILKNQQR